MASSSSRTLPLPATLPMTGDTTIKPLPALQKALPATPPPTPANGNIPSIPPMTDAIDGALAASTSSTKSLPDSAPTPSILTRPRPCRSRATSAQSTLPSRSPSPIPPVPLLSSRGANTLPHGHNIQSYIRARRRTPSPSPQDRLLAVARLTAELSTITLRISNTEERLEKAAAALDLKEPNQEKLAQRGRELKEIAERIMRQKEEALKAKVENERLGELIRKASWKAKERESESVPQLKKFDFLGGKEESPRGRERERGALRSMGSRDSGIGGVGIGANDRKENVKMDWEKEPKSAEATLADARQRMHKAQERLKSHKKHQDKEFFRIPPVPQLPAHIITQQQAATQGRKAFEKIPPITRSLSQNQTRGARLAAQAEIQRKRSQTESKKLLDGEQTEAQALEHLQPLLTHPVFKEEFHLEMPPLSYWRELHGESVEKAEEKTEEKTAKKKSKFGSLSKMFAGSEN